MNGLGTALELLQLAQRRYRTLVATVGWQHVESPQDTRRPVEGGGSPGERTVRIWIDEKRRMRQQQAITGDGEVSESILVVDGLRWWSWFAGQDPVVGDESSQGRPLPAFSYLFDPRVLLGDLSFELLGTVTHLDRPALLLRGWPQPTLHFPPYDGTVSLSLVLHGADEYELIVDGERGIILEMRARCGGRVNHLVTLRDVHFDQPIPDDFFRLPEA